MSKAEDAAHVMMAEHRNIERVLDALEAIGEIPAPREDLAEIVAVLRGYADAYHHAKEEDVLFGAMIDAGIPDDDGPVALMLVHHGEGRRLVGELAELSEAAAGPLSEAEQRTVARSARDYVTLLRVHIREEDEVVYPMARARIRPSAWDEVEEACAEIDASRAEEVEALLARAATLVERYARR
jgi:hemerythrin-like domain-containing protein